MGAECPQKDSRRASAKSVLPIATDELADRELVGWLRLRGILHYHLADVQVAVEDAVAEVK